MNARAVAAWSGACLLIVLMTTNPAYKAMVLAAALAALAAGAGFRRLRTPLVAVTFLAAFSALLNFASAHVGATVLFSLPAAIPGLGGPFTLEALAFGIVGGITIAAAVLAATPFSLMLASHDLVDALPRWLSSTGSAVAASMNLIPAIGVTFVQVSEAQRMRGWRPRGPRSWAEVAVPVVLTSVESSIQLAESMEARGFASGPRTFFSRRRMGGADWTVVVAAAVAIAGFTVSSYLGWVSPWAAYPYLVMPEVDLRPLSACLLLFVPVMAWRSRR